ncbi:MAG TPA: patatin-like phospholipase family protein, partial [Burkholderiales bacterium]|nr:patatin-like phospholipase family protein [Burkholderiales bacterium]
MALGAGGARGWAHIGVIRALAEAGVKPDVVSGTSMGALVGAAYAAGELERLEGWAKSLGRKDVLGLMDFTLRGGLIRGVKLFDFFRARVADRDVAALQLPFGAVATELTTGREVWLREGSMFDAVRASIAIPGVFSPVMRSGQLLVDGGLVNPVPVSLCRALGADIVIAVDLGWAKLGYFRERRDAKFPPKLAHDTNDLAWWERVLRLAAVGKEEPADSMPSVLAVFITSIDIMQVRIGRSRQA